MSIILIKSTDNPKLKGNISKQDIIEGCKEFLPENVFLYPPTSDSDFRHTYRITGSCDDLEMKKIFDKIKESLIHDNRLKERGITVVEYSSNDDPELTDDIIAVKYLYGVRLDRL
ncbi:hypothetical protein CE143_17645 [Photorhabdus luminescens]|uniref:Phage protein n=1 Tax=Photorhabdus akhurstii TaxID=171438 RepID=A0ABX8M0W9_9GAMM|nr:hypothetical protein [Photorhabdus akhurstii]QXF34787.1 hypothetical protein B0X70_17635 [Photorhabdus akhurstii]UJD76614.1 hypothetical protein CE143_17645 [Photorhabdus luminescens]